MIATKRDGGRLDQAAFDGFSHGVIEGYISDAQIAALLMAIYIHGLDLDETVALTLATAHSAKRIDFSAYGPVVDKHSTGGVGDTVSLIAGPIAAACDCVVPMLSGRALGHTGGTLDKLAAADGLSANIDSDDMLRVAGRAGITIAEASADLAPLDGVLYSLRDQTGTIGNDGLIAASILGKKLAVEPKGLVLDVKVGAGGFLPDMTAARRLVNHLQAVGERVGLRIDPLYTDMSQPLSSAVGNAVELDRAIHLLRGDANLEDRGGCGGLHGARLRQLSIEVAARMVALAHDMPLEDARRDAQRALDSGQALTRFRLMVEGQGAAPGIIEHPEILISPFVEQPLATAKHGYVSGWDPKRLGDAVIALGLGRDPADLFCDPQAGIHLLVDLGEKVHPGDMIATLYGTGDPGLDDARRLVGEALAVSDERRPAPELILSE